LSISGYVKLARPVNSLMIGFAVLVGEAVAVSSVRMELATLMGYLTGVFITSFSMIVNDVLDYEVDKANGARRPLVEGTATIGGAKAAAAVLLLAGLITSSYTGVHTLAVAAAFAALATLYNWKLKERGFSGNVVVALSMMIPFIYGGLLVQGWRVDPLLDLMALTAFLAGVGREVVKGIADVEGDSLRNVRSLARTRGEAFASKVGSAFFLLAVGASLVPAIYGRVSVYYTFIVGSTDVLFLALALLVLLRHGKGDALKVKDFALFGMSTGMLGFILEGLSRAVAT
jgi:geranylgeranylglycerol-phosphate geranylgeranyltransferase